MFRELKWSPVDERIKYNKAVYTYKALNNLTPDYISSLLKPLSETHSFNLRSSVNSTLYILFARTEIYKGSFSCSVPKLWNALPQTARDSDSLITFKKRIKTTYENILFTTEDSQMCPDYWQLDQTMLCFLYYFLFFIVWHVPNFNLSALYMCTLCKS